MAINERLIHTAEEAAAPSDGGTGNQQEGLILHLDANDVDSYDGNGSVWHDITNHEYTPTTNVDEHFNTVLYAGDGTTSNSITGVGFQADFVWVGGRTAGNYHPIQDSVRGVNSVIFSALDNPEMTADWRDDFGQITSFDEDGFTLSDGVGNANSNFNQNNEDYVAWCLKAGGAAVSNTERWKVPITYISRMSINNDLGFSIVKWTMVIIVPQQ